jgi:L-aminopeptidase/D-esterase-like protein
MAVAIRPIHTSHDGDTSFALSTGDVSVPFDWVANIGADVVVQAIHSAVRQAHSVGSVVGLAG